MKHRVLIIEDDLDYRIILHAMIEAEFEADFAGSLREAIARIMAGPKYDLLLLDLGLPDSQYADTFKTLSQYAGDMPIVILTGYWDFKASKEVIAAGAEGWLVKGRDDLDEETLRATMKRAIHHGASVKKLSDTSFILRELHRP